MSGGVKTSLSFTVIAAAMLIGTAARAQEAMADIDVPAGGLGKAIQHLSRQSGVSIGFRESRLAGRRVKAVRGRLTVGQALERMLTGAPLIARQVATDTYLIEQMPAPPSLPPRILARPASRQPAALREEETEAEIVVTGSKRSVPLNVYPGGVQIITGDAISLADGARGTDAISAKVASVASTHLGPGRNKLFIRGIADSSFVGPTQATVGQYWGNSRITYSAPDPSLRLYDIGSVEVLEGPQGTLYGAGSLGGVVRVVPRAPDLGSSGGMMWAGAQAVQHGQPGADGGMVINLPLIDDRLALRALAFGSADGGYIDDVGRGLNDVNDVRTVGGRASVRFAPTNDWTIDLNGVAQRIRGADSQYAERGGDDLSRSSSMAQPFRNKYWLGELVVRKQWGPLELTSSAGYARQNVFEQFEGPALSNLANLAEGPTANATPAAYVQTDGISMVTGETRLARRGPDGTGWVIGISLLRNEARVNRLMGIGPLDIRLAGVSNRVNEQTLYGEMSVKPADRLTLTVGGRLTHSRLAGDVQDVLRTVAFRVDPDANNARSELRLLPSAALAYRATEQLTVFARYQQGFRPGGIAVRQDFVQRFRGDRVSTTEAGARYHGHDFSLSLNTSWSRWSDIQADLIDGFGFPTTSNVGEGRVVSIGLSSRWQPVDGLSFDASIYLNESKVTARNVARFMIPGVISNLSADLARIDTDRLPNVADTTGRMGVSYVAPLSDKLDLQLSGFGRYVGKSTLGVGNILGQLQGDYVDTGLEIRIGSGRRALTLSLANLFDARGNRFALGSPFLVRDRNQITPLQPRSIRLGFDASF